MALEGNNLNQHIYRNTTTKKVKTLFTDNFKFTLGRSVGLKEAWYQGTLPGCTVYKVLCKIIKALLWNRTVTKTKLLPYIVIWYRLHKRKFDYAVYKRALDYVDDAIKLDLRMKRAEAQYEYRRRKKAGADAEQLQYEALKAAGYYDLE